MHIILGGTGHVGSAVAARLLAQGEAVTVVTRDEAKGEAWQRRGAVVARVDVHDSDALRRVFATGRRAFLLNPPADPATDTDVEERRTVARLLTALDGSGLEKVVAESTYGAQPGERRGDLNVLHEFEQGLRAQPIPHAIVRAAYYFSNWDALVEPARRSGVLPTLLPADLKLPMVAPDDLGRAAAELLLSPPADGGIRYVEGPERYSAGDVAAAFARALGRDVRLDVAPREQWVARFEQQGFSDAAARSYARMTAISVDGGFDMPASPLRGTIGLQHYVDALVAR